jgi:hypothetical protein
MSYYDKATYATDEAVTIGRLHCLRDGWNDALVNFMKSGGFAPSKLVPQVPVPSLVLWGRQDTILDGTEFATKFVETLPSATLVWIEECGHVPHLEQPEYVHFSADQLEYSILISDTFFELTLLTCRSVKLLMPFKHLCRRLSLNERTHRHYRPASMHRYSGLPME